MASLYSQLPFLLFSTKAIGVWRHGRGVDKSDKVDEEEGRKTKSRIIREIKKYESKE
jgi:hypothetical protein